MSSTPGNIPSFNAFTEKYPSAYELKFSETKGACDLAYKAFQDDIYKFPDGRNWKVIARKTDMSGFQAIVLKPENDRRVVLAFAGTQMGYEFRPDKTGGDLQTDLDQELGLIPRQYVLAANMAGEWRSKYGNNLVLTGHSLGGGLASYAGLYNKIPATTINPAPLAETTALRYAANKNNLRSLPVTNYIAGGREVISNNGLWGMPTGGLVKPKITLIGNIIPVAGGKGWNGIEATKYYKDHMISDTAPEVPLPVKQLHNMPGGYHGMTENEYLPRRY